MSTCHWFDSNKPMALLLAMFNTYFSFSSLLVSSTCTAFTPLWVPRKLILFMQPGPTLVPAVLLQVTTKRSSKAWFGKMLPSKSKHYKTHVIHPAILIRSSPCFTLTKVLLCKGKLLKLSLKETLPSSEFFFICNISHHE